MRNFKIFLITVLGIAGLILLLPLGTGVLIKQHYEKTITFLQIPAAQLNIVEYKQGWWSSDAKLTLTIDPKASRHLNRITQQPIVLTLNEHILHGPFIFDTDHLTGKHRFHVLLGLIESTLAHGDQKTPLQTLFYFGGNTLTRIKNANFKLVLPQLTLAFKNLNNTMLISDDQNRLEYDLTADTITFSDPHKKGHLQQFQINMDIDRHNKHALWLGHQAIKVSEIKVSVQNALPVTIKNLYASLNSNDDEDRVYMQIHGTINTLISDNKQYGPYNLSLTVRDLDAKTLLRYHTQMREMSKQDIGILQKSTQSLNLLADMLGHGLKIDLGTLSAKTPFGKLVASGNVTLAELPPARYNMLNIFRQAKGVFNLTVSKNLMGIILQKIYTKEDEAKEKLNDMIKNNWLAIAPNHYSFSLTLKKGQLNLNGHSALPPLLSPKTAKPAEPSKSPAVKNG